MIRAAITMLRLIQHMRIPLLLLATAALLTACGLKGPLYLPEQKPAAAQPTPPAAAPTQSDDKKSPGSK
jgi:predicted small lipoprotein YifL